LRTNCSDAALISSSVTGGSKLKSGFMFLHIPNLQLPGEAACAEMPCGVLKRV
jgi:hypothetical protein